MIERSLKLPLSRGRCSKWKFDVFPRAAIPSFMRYAKGKTVATAVRIATETIPEFTCSPP
jgi:hypothetical protein